MQLHILHPEPRAASDESVTEAPRATIRPSNAMVAHALDTAAALLEERGQNEHRVGAYRRAAESVRALETPVYDLVDAGGADALEAIPNVGERLAGRIAAFVQTGELALLRELREAVPPSKLFARLTGIGREMGRQIHDALGIETLEALELAAYDGRLEAVPGFGPRRVAAVRAQLDAILARHTRRDARLARGPVPPRRPLDAPSVADLLNVDDEYRYRTNRGDLPTIAPRRFNATGEAWLAVLHTRRGPWRFTALFSNTPRAHELGKTADWVVVYFEHEGRERSCTVVTETRGELRGKRVIRGREDECRAYYDYARPVAA